MSSEQQTDTEETPLSTDAFPVPPRPLAEREQAEQNIPADNSNSNDQQQTEDGVAMPDPPTDWQFNIFLKRLEGEISEKDVSDMKCLFEGEGGIGRKALEKITTASDLFSILRTRHYITRDNLIYLQAMLFVIGRKDLVKEAVQYARTIENVLHFHSPTYEPENGFKFVKLHVRGRNFQTFTRPFLDKLRKQISTILFMPERFVIIEGVEPSSSIVVTFKIPEMYVSILQDLLIEETNLPEICELGIDLVEICGDRQYAVTDETAITTADTKQQMELVNVYEQLKAANRNLDASETERLHLSNTIEKLHSDIRQYEATIHELKCQNKTLTNIFSVSSEKPEPSSLKSLSSLENFKTALTLLNDSCDREAIKILLDSTVTVVATRVKEANVLLVQQLTTALQEAQSRLVPLLFELERYKFVSNLGNVDKSVLDEAQKLLESLIAPIGQVEITLTQHGLDILKKISNKLRAKEKEKLKQKYKWPAGDKIEQFMQQDSSHFLAGIVYKEIESTRRDVNFDHFITECLSQVHREDLKKYLKEKPSYMPQSPPFFAGATPKEAHDQAHGEKEDTAQQQKQMITQMAKQVQTIHDIIKSRLDAYPTQFDPLKASGFPFSHGYFQQSQNVKS